MPGFGHRAPDTLHIWDLKTEKLTKSLRLRGSGSKPAVLSPDGRYLATYGGNVFLFDTKSHKYVAEFAASSERERALVVRFSPDGKTLAMGDTRGKLHIYRGPAFDR